MGFVPSERSPSVASVPLSDFEPLASLSMPFAPGPLKRMHPPSKAKVSFKSPVRRLLRRAAAIACKKRTYSVHLPRAFVAPSPISATPETQRRSALSNSYRIALISEVSMDDVVVVSALAAAPFCCHADLLTMDVNQLVAVARALNDALPPPLRISAEAGCQPGEICAEIEAIVGLRSPDQPATSVRPSPRFHLESPVAYRSPVNDIPHFENDGDPLSSKRHHILPTPAPRRALCAPIFQASPSPSSVVLGSRLARSVAATDMGTPASFIARSRLPFVTGQILPRMSTPVKGSQTICELTFGLEGFTVEASSESCSGSVHPLGVSS
jgi:hypothetical protein